MAPDIAHGAAEPIEWVVGHVAEALALADARSRVANNPEYGFAAD